MPYLPTVSEDTAIPLPLGRDWQLQIRLIAEKWRRFFAPLTYYPLLKAVTPTADASDTAPVGETGTTAYDPLYGEPVDPAMRTEGEWRQPHLSGDLKAFDPEVLDDPVQVNALVRVELDDGELKLWGFEKKLDVVVVFPASLLDEAGLTVQRGDQFDWGGGRYEAQQIGPNRRLWNTSSALYVAVNAQSRRKGS